MPKYGLIACFSRVMKARHWWTLEFNGTRNRKLGVGKKKKSGFWRSKRKLKLVIWLKCPVASGICYERYLSMLKSNHTHLIMLTISIITVGQLNVNSGLSMLLRFVDIECDFVSKQ